MVISLRDEEGCPVTAEMMKDRDAGDAKSKQMSQDNTKSSPQLEFE